MARIPSAYKKLYFNLFAATTPSRRLPRNTPFEKRKYNIFAGNACRNQF
jgi:hypothetical protein